MNTQQLVALFDMYAGGEFSRVYLDSVHYHKLTWWLADNDNKYLPLHPSYKGLDIYKVETQELHIYFC